MKLSFNQIEPFLKNPPKDIRVVLVYGPDAGLVSERVEGLAAQFVTNKNDPFCLSVLTGGQIAGDASLLYDEAAALSLGGGRRLIRIQQAGDSCAKSLTEFLKDPPQTDSVILIEAGELESRSKLRAACEGKTELAAAIPCYVEDTAARLRTIQAMLQEEKLTAPRDVLVLLADCLPPDRLAMRSEMNKLILYVKGQPVVTFEDVRAIIANAGGAEMDDLTQALAGGQADRVMSLLDYLFDQQTSPVALLRAAQRHFMRLQIARSYVEEGASAADAIGRLKPPVFWKNKDPMIRQVQRWPLERLELRLSHLTEAEAACKKTGTPDTTLCAQLFLNIAAKG